jgi:hypothetical protein
MSDDIRGGRFALSADAEQIIDRVSGQRWDSSAALRLVFAKEARHHKMAMDEGLDPRGSNTPQGGSAMPMNGQYDQDPNGGGNSDVAQAMAKVKQIMRALGEEARGPFISAFQAFLESDEDLDARDNNQSATGTTGDRRPGRDGRLVIKHGDRRGAGDRSTMEGGRSQAFDRALIDQRPFSERFPDTAHIRLGFGGFPGSR